MPGALHAKRCHVFRAFTARCYASVVYAVVVCLSVCLSVSVMPGIVSKRLNQGSRKQRRTIAVGLKVSVAKHFREIQTGSYPTRFLYTFSK